MQDYRDRLVDDVTQFVIGFLHMYVYADNLRQGKYCCIKAGVIYTEMHPCTQTNSI